MSPVIEKGIPIPKARATENGPSAVLRQMEIGDSILLHPEQVISYRATGNRLGFKPIIRKLSPTEYRLWRTA